LVPSLRVISFVSGKGGVGKTSLAANFAWICGRVRKTVLVDLDFHNQGATGLFLSRLPPDVHGAFELLEGGDLSQLDPVHIEDSVFFVPAVAPFMPVDYSRVSKLLTHLGLAKKLRDFANHLNRTLAFDILVFDCHGGLDSLSAAAYAASNDTLVVSEADTVAFNGTLELLDFYDSNAPRTVMTTSEAMKQGMQGQIGAGAAVCGSGQPTKLGNISFVVNRLPSKYKFVDLNSTYKALIAHYNGDLAIRPSVLSFIPEENFLADSFGEYPFAVKLAPQSVVARKLQLMMIDLRVCDPNLSVSYRPLQKLRNARFRTKVRRIVVSAESRNTNNILSAFGFVSLAFPLILVALSFLVVRWGSLDAGRRQLVASAHIARLAADSADSRAKHAHSSQIAAQLREEAATKRDLAIRYEAKAFEYRPKRVVESHGDYGVLIALMLVYVFCAYYILRAELGLTLYYDQQYKFRKALQQTIDTPSNIWQTFHLSRLWLVRLGSAVTFLITIGMAVSYGVVIVVALLGVWV